MEKKIIRLLIVDDSPDDAEVPVNILRQAGYMLKSQRVHDMATMEAAMHKGRWDLVISENILPQFSAAMALDQIKRAGYDIPFLILAREISDDAMQSMMASGVHDVIRKQQIGRLLPSIKREIRNAGIRAEYYKLASKADEVEKKEQQIIESSREAVAYVHEGVHVDANVAYLKIFGFDTKEQVAEVPLLNLIEKNDQPAFKKFIRKADQDSEPEQFTAVRQDGSTLHVEMTISPVVIEGEQCTQVVVTDVSKRQAVENKLKYLSQHDPLTGLFGRHYFMRELNDAANKAKTSGARFVLFYFNVDRLTEINEKVGYAAGDRLLLKISKILSGLTATVGIASRLGGDEFTLLLPISSTDEVEQHETLVNKALKHVSFSESGDNYQCSCSISHIEIDDKTVSSQKALSTVYNACSKNKTYKTQDKPKVKETVNIESKKFADPSDQAWEKRIKEALDKDLFELSYQPVVNLHNEAEEFYEVLLRMDEGGGNLITAGEFMPAAQRSGLMAAIDKWVLQQVVEALANLHSDNRDTSLFVNISKDTFLDKNISIFTKKALQEAGVLPKNLIIEIDDRDLMEYPKDGSETIRHFSGIGCEVSIDNFGTGLGTIDMLEKLPVNYLKLSGKALQDLTDNPKRQGIFQVMVDLGRVLGKKIVAKSVENAEALSFLYQKEVDFVQGYYFLENTGETDTSSDIDATLDSEMINAPGWSQ